MPSHIDVTQHYDADPATVFAMLSDKDFILYKCEQSASLEATAEVIDEGDTVSIHNRRVLPAKVPGFVKRFLGDTIPLDETQHWGPANGSGQRTAEFSVDFDGQPLAFGGTIELHKHGEGSAVRTKRAHEVQRSAHRRQGGELRRGVDRQVPEQGGTCRPAVADRPRLSVCDDVAVPVSHVVTEVLGRAPEDRAPSSQSRR
ncbi:MAG: DUF2505 domain-containing protein [Actinobacteria bacterium]|nr:DUF2505 domain-containing protein [Actinomycetota bacterium]